MGTKMELYITRHGESLGNVGQDSIDPPLTDTGLMQAQALGERLKKIRLDAIISSPLIRAVQTAAAVASRQGLPVELIPELMEVGTQPDYPGKAYKELLNVYEHLAFSPGFTNAGEGVCLGVEKKPGDPMRRAQRVVDYLCGRFSGEESILVVAHGTFNNYLTLAACGLPYKKGFNFSQENTGLSLVRYVTEGDGSKHIKIGFANSYSHLE